MRRRRFIAMASRAAGCALLALIAVTAQALGADWQRYTNTRYGVTIDYPADLFAIQPAPPDNAGRNFEAPRVKARSMSTATPTPSTSRSRNCKPPMCSSSATGRAKTQGGSDWYQIVAVKEADTIVLRECC